LNQGKTDQLIRAHVNKPENKSTLDKIMKCQSEGDREGLNKIIADIMPVVNAQLKEEGAFTYTDEMVKVYAEVGGTPHLDQNYTVFGEVVEGLDIIDKIAATETAPGDRPVNDIKMKIKVLN
jgi:CobQ-like glutamine amidotransferase family enzyme